MTHTAFGASNKKYELSKFARVQICKMCHGGIYKQWENSMHSLAHVDPIYRKVSKTFLKGLTVAGEIEEAQSCVKCHTPIGFFTGYPTKTSDNEKDIPAIAKSGVQCDFCHTAIGHEHPYNNAMILDPGVIKRGPYKDAKASLHQTQYSKFHTESKICGTCHNVRHVAFDTKLESTYDEWLNGPYNSDDPALRVTCQGCHMHQRPGFPATGSTERPKNPGLAAVMGPKRKHVSTHYFVGANALIPGLHNSKLKVDMAKARLKNAATLSIDTSEIKKSILTIATKNTGAGHYLPTGLTNIRQMWLEIIIKNSKGKLIFSSGAVDKNGYLPKDTIIYNTVFGDGKGSKVVNIAKAKSILSDKRIPPKKSVKERINLTKGNYGKATISVRLLYRSASQKLIDQLFKDKKYVFPIIEMAQRSITVD
ncbi:MAG: cytochrome c554 family protein [Bacteriovoracaceae bacterium]|nr:cytochrome c554 family protein [Bacteriovoracaceae bacterium]